MGKLDAVCLSLDRVGECRDVYSWVQQGRVMQGTINNRGRSWAGGLHGFGG